MERGVFSRLASNGERGVAGSAIGPLCGSGGERGVSGVGVVERDDSRRKLMARGRGAECGVGGDGVVGSDVNVTVAALVDWEVAAALRVLAPDGGGRWSVELVVGNPAERNAI